MITLVMHIALLLLAAVFMSGYCVGFWSARVGRRGAP